MKQNQLLQLAKCAFYALCLTAGLNAHAQTPSWQWAKNSSGGIVEGTYASTTDSGGNVYVSGIYQSAALSFASNTLTNTNSGSRDAFLTKYDSAGEVLWAKNIGGSQEQQILGMCTDAQGNLYITGDFASNTMSIDGLTVTNSNTNNSQDVFMAKLDSSGNALWIKSFGGGFYDYGYTITTNPEGDIYLGGIFFSASINLGGITVYNTEVNDDHDVFFAKFDASGNTIWARSAGGSGYDAIEAMTLDAEGNFYLTGPFYSPSITFADTVLSNTNNYGDSYFVKYGSSGNLIWAKTVGGTNYDNIRAIKADVSGNVFIAGHFESPTMFLATQTLTNAGSSGNDGFIAKYDSNGMLIWARRCGGLNSDFVTDLVLDSAGNPCIAGSFASPTITFGNLSPLPTAGGFDLFAAKYSKDGIALWAKATGGVNSEFAYTASIDANDHLFVTGLANSPSVNFDGHPISESGTSVYVAKIGVGPLANPSFEKNTVRIFPNPTAQILYVETTALQNAAYTIADVNGRLLSRGNSSAQTGIDVSLLQSGVYFLHFDQYQSVKFIKE